MNLLKTTTIAFGSVALASMVASPAMAFQLGTFENNNRPVTVAPNGSDDGPGQDIISQQSNAGRNTNQTGISSFSFNGAPGGAASIILEIAGFAPQNTFGIYEPGNTNNQFQLFDGGDTVPDRMTFNSSTLGTNNFAFYISTPENNTFFQEDSLNGGAAQSLVFDEGGGLYTVAFEDKVFANSDQDFNDFVVQTKAVPEPTTMLGLAIAGGLGAFGAKKKKQSEDA